MSFVTQVTEEQADTKLKSFYDAVRSAFGFLPNYYQALGISPELAEADFRLGGLIAAEGALPRKIKDQIGVVVSGLNTSSYCVALHLELLRALGIEKPMGRKLATDYPNAPVEPNVQALFRLADKLTRKPGDVTKADADAVRAAGWSERQLFETVMAVALFNFYNRVALGLGLMADF